MLNKRIIIEKTIAVFIWLLLWQLAAMAVGQSILLASPIETVKRLIELIWEENFMRTIWFSFRRIIGGFLAGAAAACFLAMLSGKYRWFETLLQPLMFMIKTVPVASFVIIALVWLSSSVFSGFIAFLIVVPVIYNNILTGIKSIDNKMIEMAEIFKISFKNRFIYIWLPAIKPYVFACFSTALGMCWKAGIAAEIIGIPDGSIGEALYRSKAYLDTAALFAWTAVIVVLSVIGERMIMYLIKEFYRRLEAR